MSEIHAQADASHPLSSVPIALVLRRVGYLQRKPRPLRLSGLLGLTAQSPVDGRWRNREQLGKITDRILAGVRYESQLFLLRIKELLLLAARHCALTAGRPSGPIGEFFTPGYGLATALTRSAFSPG